MKHPLINPNSSHYDKGSRPAILELEEQLTIEQMIGFCKANIFKYQYRKTHKGQADSDEIKIKTYEDYLELLQQVKDDLGCNHIIVMDAYNLQQISLDYGI